MHQQVAVAQPNLYPHHREPSQDRQLGATRFAHSPGSAAPLQAAMGGERDSCLQQALRQLRLAVLVSQPSSLKASCPGRGLQSNPGGCPDRRERRATDLRQCGQVCLDQCLQQDCRTTLLRGQLLIRRQLSGHQAKL